MIKSIHLLNFQSHNATDIDLCPGVNVIVGPSDSGKTAITRGLRWALRNEPSGDEFRRNGTTDTRVLVSMTDCQVERWKKGTSKNGYILEHGKKEQTFEAFGATVPEAIQKVANVGDINWQSQLDAPFLLCETAGEVARQLNAVTRLDVIDTALTSVAGKFRETKRHTDACAEALGQAKVELEKYSTLDVIETAMRKAEATEEHHIHLRERIALLERLKNLAGQRAAIIRKMQPATLNKAEKLLQGVSFDTTARDKHTRLTALYREGVRLATKCEDTKVRIETAVARLPETCPVCGKPL